METYMETKKRKSNEKYLMFLKDISEMDIIKPRTPAMYHIDSSLMSKMVHVGCVEKVNGGYKWIGGTPDMDMVAKVKAVYNTTPKAKTEKESITIKKYYEFMKWLHYLEKFNIERESLKLNVSQQVGVILGNLGFIKRSGSGFAWGTKKPRIEDAQRVHSATLSAINESRNKGKSFLKIKKYSENVSMTEAQYNGLVERHGEDYIKEMIEKLKNYKFSTGKKYKSDYHTLLNWINRSEDNLTDEKAINHLRTSKNAIYEIIKIEREKIGEMPTKESANSAIEMMQDVVGNEYSIIKVLMQNDKYSIFKCKRIECNKQ